MSVTPRRPLAVQPHPYIGDVVGRPLDRGMIYFGEPDKDPQDYPITVYLDPEQTKPAHQPIRTKGGFINVFGDITEIFADEILYSLKVLDCYGRLVFYKKRMHRDNITEELGGEIVRAQKAESALQSSIDAETTRAKKAESDLNTNIIKEVNDRKLEVTRLDEVDAVLQAQINSVGGGKLAYKTYAAMVADKANITANSSIDVLADTDDKNGTYSYDGTNFVKSQYDIEKIIRAKVQNTFGTYAQMVASNLSDGSYALVADDADNKNGIYIKKGGAWVKSGYDPLTQAKAYADVHPDVATGRAAVADGEQFQVISSDGEVIRYRRDSSTTQTEVARLASANGVRTGKAVGRGAITPQQTSFVRGGGGINLFDGEYLTGTLNGNSPYDLMTDRGGLCAIIPVSAETTYTISIGPGTDRFRFACFAEFPQVGSVPTSYYKADNDFKIVNGAFTLTTDPDTAYLVVVPTSAALNQAPKWLQVEVGDTPTEYISPKKLVMDLSKNSIPLIEPEMTSFFEKGRNLFDGEYLTGTLNGNSPYDLMTDRGGLCAIIPVSAETTYTISKAPGTNRFRFACFAEYPRVGSVPTSFYKADNDEYTLSDEFTLTTDPDTAYLVVVPTSAKKSQAPEWMQVEVGAEKTPYTKPFTIKPELLPTTGTAQRKRVDIVISGDFDAHYDPITPAPVMDSSLNLAVVYAWFDDLVARFPDLWSRSLLATDTSGLPVYRYDCKPPVTRGILSESLPKILHVNGIHGDEKQSIGSGMRFYKDLTDNWQSSTLLEIFRWNTHFIVIPAFNAYGVENNTRGNANGVNLNRNFPINWKFATDSYNASGPEPLSEPESVAMMELLKTEKNIIFAIDHHRYNPYSQYSTNDAFTIWTGTNNTSVNKYLSGWSRLAQGIFAKKHPELAVGNLSRVKIEEALAMRSLGWLSKCFIDNGIAGTILEISRDSHLSDFHTSALGSLFGFALKELHADKSKWFK